jgi:hypothetical protein
MKIERSASVRCVADLLDFGNEPLRAAQHALLGQSETLLTHDDPTPQCNPASRPRSAVDVGSALGLGADGAGDRFCRVHIRNDG